MRNSLLYNSSRPRNFGYLGCYICSVHTLFQTIHTVKMEATHVLCENLNEWKFERVSRIVCNVIRQIFHPIFSGWARD